MGQNIPKVLVDPDTNICYKVGETAVPGLFTASSSGNQYEGPASAAVFNKQRMLVADVASLAHTVGLLNDELKRKKKSVALLSGLPNKLQPETLDLLSKVVDTEKPIKWLAMRCIYTTDDYPVHLYATRDEGVRLLIDSDGCVVLIFFSGGKDYRLLLAATSEEEIWEFLEKEESRVKLPKLNWYHDMIKLTGWNPKSDKYRQVLAEERLARRRSLEEQIAHLQGSLEGLTDTVMV